MKYAILIGVLAANLTVQIILNNKHAKLFFNVNSKSNSMRIGR